MSSFLRTNDAALASMQSHLGSTMDAAEIPPTKSPITNLQYMQAEYFKIHGVLKKNYGKV